MQLSKLFGVTADYLLNDDYQSDRDIPVIMEVEKTANSKIRKIAGICITVASIAGNFVIYLLSRFIEVMVPIETHDGNYFWSSDYTDYNYKYFIREHNLELLTAVF